MLDAPVHAALVVVFAFLIKLLAAAVGIDLGEDLHTQLAGVIVAYILSLFGYSLWIRGTSKFRGFTNDQPRYRPPFT